MAIRSFFLMSLPALAEGALCMAGAALNFNVRPVPEYDNRTCDRFQTDFFMGDMTRQKCFSSITVNFSVLQGSMVLSVAEASAHLTMPCCNSSTSPCDQYLPTQQNGMCPTNFTPADMGKCMLCNGTIGYVDTTQNRCVKCNIFETEGCRDAASCTTNQGYWDGYRCFRCSASNPRQCPPAMCSMYGGRWHCYNPSDPSSCNCQSCTPGTSGDISGCGEQWCRNATNQQTFQASWQCYPNSTSQMWCECGRCCAGDNCNNGGSHWPCDQQRCTPQPGAPDVVWIADNFNGTTWGRCTRCVNYGNMGPSDTQGCLNRTQCLSIGAQWTCTTESQRGCCQFNVNNHGQCVSLASQDVQRVRQNGWTPLPCSR